VPNTCAATLGDAEKRGEFAVNSLQQFHGTVTG
jgi:hypothetical protein